MTTVTGAVQTALSANPYIMARFLSIAFPDYTARLWTGVGPFTLLGDVYTGMGSLGSIAPVTDKSDLSAQRIQMSLTGLDPALMADVRNYLHQGSTVQIIEAQLDQDLNVVPDPYVIFIGEVDVMSASLGETMTITCQADNFISFIFRGPDGHRQTAADQIALFTGDLGLNFCASTITDIPWGSKGSVATSSGSSGGGTASTSVPAYAL